MKKVFKIIGYLVLLVILLLGGAYFTLNKKLPVGVKGEKAEALAQKMIQAVNKTAWDTTHIISWTYRGDHNYLWDKQRNVAQVEWKTYKVLIDLNKVSGRVWDNLTEITDPHQAATLLKEAQKYFINDAFWLNPVVKIYDAGVERSLVTLEDGTESLLVSYTSGGLTPGDSYLWLVDAHGIPTAWQLWVKILPIGGIELTWEDWITLPTGAKIATMHKGKLTGSGIPVTHIKASTSLDAHGFKEDPFLSLY